MPPLDDDDGAIQELLDEAEKGHPAETGDEGGEDELPEDDGEAGQDDEGLDVVDAKAQDGGEEGSRGRVNGKGRSNSTIRELRDRAQRAEQKALLLEQQRAMEVQQRQMPQQETPEQEAARLSLMTSEERMDYKLEKAQRQHQAQLRQVQMQAADQMDRQAFQGLARENKLVARFKDEVETTLQQIRTNGGNATRENICDYLIGKAMREKANVSIKQQQKQGQQSVRRNTVPVGTGRSDITSSRRETNASASRAKRLEDLEI